MNLQWKAASGYIQGLGHAEMNEPCQDRASGIHDGEMHAIVLADGAGSCRYSEKGAELVVQTLTEQSKSHFEEWYSAENSALLIEEFLIKRIDEEVAKYDQAERMDFSCTLLFVLVKDGRYLAGHIGDGVIFQRINNELSVLSHPENGRYINETYFITMSPLNEHFRTYKGEIEGYMDFMLMSDGAASSFYIQTDREIETSNTTVIFNHLVENDEQDVNSELAGLLEMIRENTSDDCSLAVLTSHTIDMIDEYVIAEEDEETGDSPFEASEREGKLEESEDGGEPEAEDAQTGKFFEQVNIGEILPEASGEMENEESSDLSAGESSENQDESDTEEASYETFRLDLPVEDDSEPEDDSVEFTGEEEDYSPEFEDEDESDYSLDFDDDEGEEYLAEFEDQEEEEDSEFADEKHPLEDQEDLSVFEDDQRISMTEIEEDDKTPEADDEEHHDHLPEIEDDLSEADPEEQNAEQSFIINEASSAVDTSESAAEVLKESAMENSEADQDISQVSETSDMPDQAENEESPEKVAEGSGGTKNAY